MKATQIKPTEDVVVFVRGGVAYLYLKEGKGLTGVVWDDDDAVATDGDHVNLDLTGYEWI